MNDKIDYSKTINMPEHRLPMKAKLTEREPEILRKWGDKKIYGLLQERNRENPTYILHDGPPYANGDIHMGHALNKILKDIIVKYKTLRGFRSPYVPGWDCHGLPVELNVIKEIRKKKEDTSNKNIRNKCREYAKRYVEIQKKEFERLGIFGDWENPYLTISREYESAITRAFADLVEAGYIYRGYKPVHWCTRCTTALAEAEVEYLPHTSPAITFKFQVNNQPGTFLLVWTTTPWTLFGNVAVCMHPDFPYERVSVNDNETWIMASALVDNVMELSGIENWKKTGTFSAGDLENQYARHPFLDRDSKIILGQHVTQDTGTGCVHTAPGHGNEDYDIGMKYKLDIISPVDERGKLTDVPDIFKGIFVFDANSKIIQTMKDTGSLINENKIEHSYPHCWRCKKPVIFRSTPQWFLSMEHNNLRGTALDNIDKVEWIPRWGSERFRNMLKTRPDWCLSRQRNWGVPIPALHCRKCNTPVLDTEFIRDVAKSIDAGGSVDVWFEKDIAELSSKKIICPQCGNENLEKETDILDVWFDSGTSWAAVLKQRSELAFPADMYLEGSDQHRGWFQSSLIPSIALMKTAPYRTVLTHGFMLDDKGKAMHKSAGNAISPLEVIDKYGADILRLWVASEDYREDISISMNILKRVSETYRKIRNTCRFLADNLYDFKVEDDSVPFEDLEEMERYVLSVHKKTVEKVTVYYDRFQFHSVFHTINRYCTVHLSSEYCDWVKDRLYCEPENSKTRRSVQTVLFTILRDILVMLSPILSFTAEDLHGHINPGETESIFLHKWPETQEIKDTPDWEELLELKDELFKAIEKAKNEKIIKRPQEASVTLVLSQEDSEKLSNRNELLKKISMLAEIKLEPGGAEEGKSPVHTYGNMSFYVKRTDFHKCPRCWRYLPDVRDPSSICTRCDNVLKEGK